MTGQLTEPSGLGAVKFRVALLIETSHEFGRGLLRGIQAYVLRHGPWGLHVMPGDFTQILPAMRSWRGTGIIARVTTRSLEQAIHASGLPFVGVCLTERQVAPGGNFAGKVFIHADSESIARVAIEHLLERGLRNIAFVGEADGTRWSSARQRAAVTVLAKEHGISCRVYPPPPKAGQDWGREIWTLARWLAGLPRPCGIIAPTDLRGRQVIEACREAGLRVPDEAAVIGVDNEALLCALCDPPLTSVALDVERVGWQAAQVLDSLMRGEKVASKPIVINPVHVVARLSTATADAPDPRIAAALRFILRHSHHLIQVSDVAKHAGLSRRSLEARFRAATSQTVLSEIRRMRLSHVSTLLRESDASVTDIAAASGFASANYLAKVYKRAHGVTPQAFRAKVRCLEPPP
ncbi:MAG TPA: DNA-binding transcriptional regulator [Verrucomicrobiae bacterium]|jgi:LacI family transcriptional regulator